jgi:hypothetical protein
MMEAVASALIIGMLAEMRLALGKMDKRVRQLEDHSAIRRAVSAAHSAPLILACLFLASCGTGEATGAVRDAAGALKDAVTPAAATVATSPSEHLEAGSYLWAKITLGIGAMSMLASIVLRFWMPYLTAVWDKMSIAAAITLGAGVMLWTLAPAMFWIFWILSALQILVALGALAIYARRYMLAHHEPDSAAAQAVSSLIKKEKKP